MVRPRFASTVVLLRPIENDRFEIFLTRRPAQMKFLGGYYVFPGGTVHKADYAPQVLARCRGLSGDEARRVLGDRHEPEEALGHWVAVVRELFEEVGVLLCHSESGEEVNLSTQAQKTELEQHRRSLVTNAVDFAAFLASAKLYCDLSRVVYFDHWITPAIYSMRFDTRFYLTSLPANQTPLSTSEEVSDSLWIKPHEFSSRVYHDDFPIVPPTTTVIARLAEIKSWTDLRNRYRLA